MENERLIFASSQKFHGVVAGPVSGRRSTGLLSNLPRAKFGQPSASPASRSVYGCPLLKRKSALTPVLRSQNGSLSEKT